MPEIIDIVESKTEMEMENTSIISLRILVSSISETKNAFAMSSTQN